MEKLNSSHSRSIIRVIATMLALLCVSSILIFFGSRGDATSVAMRIKSGVVTADEINVAFENVGGRLVKRDIEESQYVKKGDILMILDDADMSISIDKLKAQIDAQKASIAHQMTQIEIDTKNTDLEEKTQYHNIEQLQAALNSAGSAENLAFLEYDRSRKLITSKSISKSAYDSNSSALTRAKATRVQAQRALDAATAGASKEELEKLRTTGSAAGMTLTSISNSRLAIANANNTLESMKAQLRQLEADLRQLELNNSRLILKAPEDGKILNIMYQQGEMISPNAPALVLETSRKYFDIYVNETQVLNYKPGQKVKAHVIASDSYVNGTVRFATAAPSFSDLRMTREHGQADLTMFKVRIYLDENCKECLPGMTMEVADDE